MNPSFRWYVYQLIDPRTSSVFYVGKGQRSRMFHHEMEARRGKHSKKADRIREIWDAGLEVVRAQVAFFCDEQAAYDFETEVIEGIGLCNLTNVLPGGQKAWDRRVAIKVQREHKSRERKFGIAEWRKSLGGIAWVARRSNGLQEWLHITHHDEYAALRNSIGAAIDKSYGNVVELVRQLLRNFVLQFGVDVANEELMPYGVSITPVRI